MTPTCGSDKWKNKKWRNHEEQAGSLHIELGGSGTLGAICTIYKWTEQSPKSGGRGKPWGKEGRGGEGGPLSIRWSNPLPRLRSHNWPTPRPRRSPFQGPPGLPGPRRTLLEEGAAREASPPPTPPGRGMRGRGRRTRRGRRRGRGRREGRREVPATGGKGAGKQ